MPEISTHSLLMAIKALRTSVEKIRTEMNTHLGQQNTLSDLEQELFDYAKAQTELKRVYITIQKQSDNLPEYEVVATD